jgi:hypothetical protein
MAMEYINNLINLFITGNNNYYIEIIKMVKKVDVVRLYGLMALFFKGTFKTMQLKEMVNLYGLMEKYMKDLGKIIKCKEKVYSFGLMEESTKEILKKI